MGYTVYGRLETVSGRMEALNRYIVGNGDWKEGFVREVVGEYDDPEDADQGEEMTNMKSTKYL